LRDFREIVAREERRKEVVRRYRTAQPRQVCGRQVSIPAVGVLDRAKTGGTKKLEKTRGGRGSRRNLMCGWRDCG